MISIAFGAPFFCESKNADRVNNNFDLKKLLFNLVLQGDPVLSIPSKVSANSRGHAVQTFRSTGEVKNLGEAHCDGEVRHADLREIDWTHEDFYIRYRSVLIRNEASPSSIGQSSSPAEDFEVTTPAPKVVHTTWKALDSSGKPYIVIKGENLLFQTQPVRLKGTESWTIFMQKDSEVWIIAPDRSKLSRKVPNILVVTTAFGATDHVMSKEYKAGKGVGEVSTLLRRIVQICVMDATPPRCSIPESLTLDKLDGVMQCVPELKNESETEPLSKLLGKIAHGLDAEKAEVGKIAVKVNDMVTKVTDYLSNSFELHYDEKVPFFKNWVTYTAVLPTKTFRDLIPEQFGGARKAIDKALNAITPSGSHKNYCLYFGLGTSVVVAGSAVALSSGFFTIPLLVAGIGAIATLAGTGTFVTAVALNMTKSMIPEYTDLLKLAILEASDWCRFGQCQMDQEFQKSYISTDCTHASDKPSDYKKGQFHRIELEDLSQSEPGLINRLQNQLVKLTSSQDNSNQDESSFVAKLEGLLFETVTNHEEYFNNLLENRDGVLTNRKLVSDLFDGASLDSKQKLLNKMKIVKYTIDLHNIYKDRRYVSIIGEEDSGKTTFIKLALERCNKEFDYEKLMSERGYTKHTKNVRCYNLHGPTWLVDFPGSNGIEKYADEWKQFTAVTKSCVLLLNFQFRIKKEQCELYETMKKELGTDITVVFNKVDEKFTKRHKSDFTKKNFDELKDTAKRNLEPKGKHVEVYFASLDPEDESKMPRLREVGVLGFEEIVHKVLNL